MPLEFDTAIDAPAGVILASYGPRQFGVGGETVESVEPAAAQFWGVYRHNELGEAEFFADGRDVDSAKAVAELLSTHAKPDTVAFIALGVGAYFAEHPGVQSAVGQLDLVSAAVSYAATIDTLAQGLEIDSLCFAYNVTKPFGRWAVQQQVNCGGIDPKKAVGEIRALLAFSAKERA